MIWAEMIQMLMQSMFRPADGIVSDPKLVWPSSQAWNASAFWGYLIKFKQTNEWVNMMIRISLLSINCLEHLELLWEYFNYFWIYDHTKENLVISELQKTQTQIILIVLHKLLYCDFNSSLSIQFNLSCSLQQTSIHREPHAIPHINRRGTLTK